MELRPRRTSNIKVPSIQPVRNNVFGLLRRGQRRVLRRHRRCQSTKIIITTETLYNSLLRPSHLANRRTGRGRPHLVLEPWGCVSTTVPIVAVRILAARSLFRGHSLLENGLRNSVSFRL